MHEHSLMADLIAKILAVAADNDGRQVTRVAVWLGALSHLSAAHFREHFEQAARGTIAAGATLEIELSADIHHPEAADIRLRSVELRP